MIPAGVLSLWLSVVFEYRPIEWDAYSDPEFERYVKRENKSVLIFFTADARRDIVSKDEDFEALEPVFVERLAKFPVDLIAYQWMSNPKRMQPIAFRRKLLGSSQIVPRNDSDEVCLLLTFGVTFIHDRFTLNQRSGPTARFAADGSRIVVLYRNQYLRAG